MGPKRIGEDNIKMDF